MFWIGFGAGAGIAFIVSMVTIGAMATSVRNKKYDKYWEDSLEVQNRNADTFERIEDLLTKR